MAKTQYTKKVQKVVIDH